MPTRCAVRLRKSRMVRLPSCRGARNRRLFPRTHVSLPPWNRTSIVCVCVCVFSFAAIQGLPSSVTYEYRMALKREPELVKTETNPVKFLYREDGNPRAAALRLAKHWTLRRHVFGESRWLLPLRVNNGALRPDDVELLRTGTVCLLTPTEPDQRQVFLVNLTRVQGADLGKSRWQICMFFGTTQLSDFSMSHGVDVVILFDGTGAKVQPDHDQMLQKMESAGLIKIHRILLVDDPDDTTRPTLRYMFALLLRRIVEKVRGTQGSLVNVTTSTRAETRQALVQQHFLHPSVIPTQAGGDFCYETHFQAWFDRQCSTIFGVNTTVATATASTNLSVNHDKRPPAASTTGQFASFDPLVAFPPVPATAAKAPGVSSAGSLGSSVFSGSSSDEEGDDGTQTSSLSTEDNANKRRLAINRKSAMRHYYKTKRTLKQIQDEYESLRRHKRKLLAEEALLRNLWSQAQRVVADHGGEETSEPMVGMD